MRLSENILKLSQAVKEIKISYFEIFSQIFEQKKILDKWLTQSLCHKENEEITYNYTYKESIHKSLYLGTVSLIG